MFSCLWYSLDLYPRIGTKPRSEAFILACITKGTEPGRSFGRSICNMQKEHACSLARTAMAEPRTNFGMDVIHSLVCTTMAEPKTTIWGDEICSLTCITMVEPRIKSWCRLNMNLGLYRNGWTKDENFGKMKHAPWFVPRWPNQGLEF